MKPQVEEERLPNPPEPGLQTEASSNRRLWGSPSDRSPQQCRGGLTEAWGCARNAVLCVSSQPSPCWILRVSVISAASEGHPERILRGPWAWELGFHSSSCPQKDSGLRHPHLSALQFPLDWASGQTASQILAPPVPGWPSPVILCPSFSISSTFSACPLPPAVGRLKRGEGSLNWYLAWYAVPMVLGAQHAGKRGREKGVYPG